jgi:MoaA/NifB/PqqE/SkfB family radical SAM enzyme
MKKKEGISLHLKTKVLCNGNRLFDLNPPDEKTLLWHITSKCNFCCKYCYGSFEGGSYKENFTRRKDAPLRCLLQAVRDLSILGFKRAHICGGEPFLRADIWRFLIECSKNDLQSFVLTNGSFLPRDFSRYFASGIFTNLSFSLDSLKKENNDWLRGHTDDVVENIERVIKLKAQYGVSTELGLYVVVTKRNLFDLKDLVDWAVNVGLNYITLQIVFLPSSHPFYDELVITKSLYPELNDAFEYLKKKEESVRIPGRVLFELTNQFALENSLSAADCFCEQDLNYLFIDGSGNVRRCPSKHILDDRVLGNICKKRLIDMSLRSFQSRRICSELTPDCIGVWEMSYPSTFVNNK